MITQLVKRFGMKLEAGIISLLLLYNIGVFIIPSLEKFMNLANYGIVAFLITWRWKRCIYVATRDIPLLLLFATAVASISWSAAPEYTIREIIPLLRAILLGIYLAARYRVEELVRIFTWVFGLGTLLGLAGSLSSSLRGFLGYKNNLGTIATIAAMLFLLAAIDKRMQRWVALAGFGMAVALVLLSQSKSALSVFLILLSLWPLSKIAKQHYKLRVVLLVITLLLGSIVTVLISNSLETIVVDQLGKDMQFNGRTPLWNLVLEKGLERPWLGYGYVGFWTSEAGRSVVYTSWASDGGGDLTARFNAHNGFIDLFVQLGVVGFLLYILNLLTVLLRTIYLFFYNKKNEFFGFFQIIMPYVLLSFTDSVNGMILSPSPYWIIYISIVLSTRLYYNRYFSPSCVKSTSRFV